MNPTTPKTTDEPKQSLPVGHPQAGYVSPDLSTHDGTGTLPDSEKEWHEARNDARDEEVEAVAEAEDKAAKEEAERLAKEAEALRKWEEEQGLRPPAPPSAESAPAPKSTTSSTSS
jgi:predicted nucleic acid-binding Zn ribbon protein